MYGHTYSIGEAVYIYMCVCLTRIDREFRDSMWSLGGVWVGGDLEGCILWSSVA